jgi:hypothetical protein
MPEFKINIRADNQGFGQVIQNTVTSLNSKLTGALTSRLGGFLSGGALAFSAKSVIDYASQFNDSASKLGVGVEFLQEAAFAAKQTGATMGDVEMALKRMQVSTIEALSGKPGNEAQTAFERLGVSLEDLRTKSVEDVFRKIAEHVQRAGQSGRTLTDMLQLMGRSADSLLPAFVQGFSDLAKEAYRLGLVLDDITLKKLDAMGDKLDVISLKWKILIANLTIGADNISGFFEKAFMNVAAAAAKFQALRLGFKPEMAEAIGQSILDEFYNKIVEENRPQAKQSAVTPFPEMQARKEIAQRAISPLGQDQFARQGLYVTAGAQGLAQTQLGLLRSANIKLDSIKMAIDNNTTVTRNILD